MFYVGLAFTLFFLVFSIILFVRNSVAKLIGDVTGWSARKNLKEIKKKEIILLVENETVLLKKEDVLSVEGFFDVEDEMMVTHTKDVLKMTK